MLARANGYSEELQPFQADDEPDTMYWKNNATAFDPVDEGRFSIWWAVCNETANPGLNASSQNASNSSNLSLAGYPVLEGVFCAEQDQLEGRFTNESAAADACDNDACMAVLDEGCRGESFRLCQIGAKEHPSSAGTCLRLRMRRGVQEQDFWREFCTRHSVPFRELFPGRRCSSGKVLPGADTESDCAELAKADPQCSEFFDWRPPVMLPERVLRECRCLPVGASCSAQADPNGDVYVLG